MTLFANSASGPAGQEFQLEGTTKGIPGGTKPFPLSGIAAHKWNVLREDLPFPLMVLKRSALLNNAHVMHAFLQEHRLSIAPHAKTHMSPQLIDLQLSSGAWGITAATVSQLQVFRRFGVSRIILANQLVGRQNIRVNLISAGPYASLAAKNIGDIQQMIDYAAQRSPLPRRPFSGGG